MHLQWAVSGQSLLGAPLEDRKSLLLMAKGPSDQAKAGLYTLTISQEGLQKRWASGAQCHRAHVQHQERSQIPISVSSLALCDT